MSAYQDAQPTVRARARADFIERGMIAKVRQHGHLETATLIKVLYELHAAYDAIEKVRFSADEPATAPELPETP